MTKPAELLRQATDPCNGRTLARQIRRGFLAFCKDEGGQALVEYVLMLAIAIGVVSAIGAIFRRTMFTLWKFYAKQISAACPGCPADTAIR